MVISRKLNITCIRLGAHCHTKWTPTKWLTCDSDDGRAEQTDYHYEEYLESVDDLVVGANFLEQRGPKNEQ